MENTIIKTKTYPEAIAHYPQSTQIFIKTIHNRIESGKNCLVAVLGGTGSGKSWGALSLSIGLDLYRYGKAKSKEYYINHCVFKAKGLMKGLNDSTLKKKTNWIWDEAGIDAGSGEHATIKNKVIGWLAQTFRNLQQVVFFTLPTLGMLTHQVRKLLHYYVEALGVDKKKNVCIMKPLAMQYNTRMDKIYYHNLTFPSEDDMIQEVDFMGVPKAPQELLTAYEEKKSAFTKDLNLKIQSMLEKVERKEKKDLGVVDRDHICRTELQENIFDSFKEAITSTREIAKLFGTKPSIISQNKRYMKNRGWKPQNP